MVRVKQFADDLAISKKQAKNLINKGRNRKDGGSQIMESHMPIYFEGMDKKKKKVPLPKPRPKNIKKKKTSEQIIREKNEYDITKSDITESLDKEFSRKVAKQNEEAMKNVKKTNKKKDGGFPDLTGDGKVTKKDILKGRGVPGFSRGGGMAIQGLGFRGVK